MVAIEADRADELLRVGLLVGEDVDEVVTRRARGGGTRGERRRGRRPSGWPLLILFPGAATSPTWVSSPTHKQKLFTLRTPSSHTFGTSLSSARCRARRRRLIWRPSSSPCAAAAACLITFALLFVHPTRGLGAERLLHCGRSTQAASAFSHHKQLSSKAHREDIERRERGVHRPASKGGATHVRCSHATRSAGEATPPPLRFARCHLQEQFPPPRGPCGRCEAICNRGGVCALVARLRTIRMGR